MKAKSKGGCEFWTVLIAAFGGFMLSTGILEFASGHHILSYGFSIGLGLGGIIVALRRCRLKD